MVTRTLLNVTLCVHCLSCSFWDRFLAACVYVDCWIVSVNKDNVIMFLQCLWNWNLGLFILYQAHQNASKEYKGKTPCLKSGTHPAAARPAGLQLRSLLSTICTAPCLCKQITASQRHLVYTRHTVCSFPTLFIGNFTRSVQVISTLC